MQQVTTSANIVVVPCKRTQHVQGFQNKPAAGGVPPVTLSFPAERNIQNKLSVSERNLVKTACSHLNLKH